jgi:hypothetical protein
MDPAPVEQDGYVLERGAVERDEIGAASGFETAHPLAIGEKARVGSGRSAERLTGVKPRSVKKISSSRACHSP